MPHTPKAGIFGATLGQSWCCLYYITERERKDMHKSTEFSAHSEWYICTLQEKVSSKDATILVLARFLGRKKPRQHMARAERII
ncbi:LexA repressor [Bacillus sp. NRRL B-14911]|nr:LexA repressor [Bacillus sp. NRRL B-14911]